jgi:hypothetical protein
MFPALVKALCFGVFYEGYLPIRTYAYHVSLLNIWLYVIAYI